MKAQQARLSRACDRYSNCVSQPASWRTRQPGSGRGGQRPNQAVHCAHLARHVIRAVCLGDVLVRGWVPVIRVDAVGDTWQGEGGEGPGREDERQDGA